MAHLFRGEETYAAEALKEKIRDSRPRDGDRDDAEVIFVGMEHVKDDAEILCVRVISSSKPVISNILNRVTKDSHSRRKKGHVAQGPACTLQPANRVTLTSKAVAVSSASLSEWGEIDSHTGSEPLSKPDCHNSSLPGMLPESSDLLSPWSHCLHGAAHPTGGKYESPRDLKRLSASDGNINSGNPKRLKLGDGFPGAHSSAAALPSLSPTKNMSTASEGVPTPSSHAQGGPSFPWAHATDKAHFNLIDPDGACSLEKLEKTDFSSQSSQNETVDPKKGSLIMLLDDFYYGQHTGDGQPEQKTHTTFKCPSCLKVLKNVKFMTHMRNHLELEKQRCDGWEIHTTCQHCHRQSPTPFQLQCHIESVHTAQEPSVVCKICELSFETDQVLLQHMKDNHKPGEMPYECPVCSYRSSAFADVEAHFRTCHENTKNLLCLFCLKIFKVVTSYVNHSWRHWNKRVYRCSKCRLQFLTFKEKTEHQTKNHQPVKKPEQLEGLPPETEVVIRTSVQPGSRRAASIVVSNTDPQLSPAKAEKEMATNRRYSRRIAARALAEN